MAGWEYRLGQQFPHAKEAGLHPTSDEPGGRIRYDPSMRHLSRVWATIDQRPALTDGGIAVLLCLLALLTIRLNWQATHPLPTGEAVAFTIALMLPLAWRRRFPLAVLGVMTPVLILYRLAEVPEDMWSANAWWLALFGAGAFGTGRWRNWTRTAGVVAITGLVAYELSSARASGFQGSLALLWLVTLASNAAFFTWVWWFGDVMRIRREREGQLAERTRQLEREREENARRAVFDERVRIARELHDVVAHHVSLMGVQAGAARRVLGQRPERAEEALAAIEGTSRQAVLEMHRLLGFLRQERDDEALAPQPSMRQLGTLVTQMREAGLPVELKVEGRERALPPGVDLSAYRIVQEALTNTLKHAGPAKVAVTVRYGERAVEIEVIDDGRSTVPGTVRESGGNGLIGMRERVSLLGGRLQVGHHPEVGFSVRAHLPLDGQAA